MSSANNVQRGALIRVRWQTFTEEALTPFRAGLGIVGMLAPLVMLTGLGTDIHDLSWYVYYGWSSTGIPVGQAAPDAPVWLAWAVVALLALRWRRLAAGAAWLALAGMIYAIAADTMLPTAQTGGWLLLAVLACVGLTFAPSSFRGLANLGRRRLLTMLVAVVLVLFARLLGHQYAAADFFAWAILAAAAVYAARPRTIPGRWALLLLSIPAVSATITLAMVDSFSFNIYRPHTPWLVMILAFYCAPVLVAAVLAKVLRRWLSANQSHE